MIERDSHFRRRRRPVIIALRPTFGVALVASLAAAACAIVWLPWQIDGLVAASAAAAHSYYLMRQPPPS